MFSTLSHNFISAEAEASAVSTEKPAPLIKGSAGPRVDWNMLELAVIRCTCLQYSAIGRAELQQRIQPQGSIPWLNRRDWYMPVRTSTYQYILSCTSLYWTLYHHVPPCTCLYLFVLERTYQYIPVYTSTYCLVPPCTDPCTTMYLLVLACTSLYLLVPKSTYRYIPVCTAIMIEMSES